MKNEKKKKRFPKLSIKIILTLLLVLIAVLAFLNIIFAIARAAGFKSPENKEEIDTLMRFIVYFFPPIFGAGIIALFSLALNRMVVSRICKLEEATKEVAKGNFDISVIVKGTDELSDLTSSFNQMSAELKSNEYLSKDFVRNVSHEFKTPLSIIKGYGEMIESEALSKKPNSDNLIEYSRAIMSESDRLTQLSKSILQLSLLGSTTIIKKDDVFKPAEQVREILRLMQAKWSEKNIALDLVLEEIAVTSNEYLLYQVWQNLISNAIKFCDDGGTIKIVVTRYRESGVYFEVTDNGIGIKDEDKAQIFAQFYMADKSRNTEGSGLGLHIVKKIAERLGGETGFESQEGKGSKFFIQI